MAGRGVSRLWADQTAVTLLEYTLIAGLVALAIVSNVAKIGSRLEVIFTNLAAYFHGA